MCLCELGEGVGGGGRGKMHNAPIPSHNDLFCHIHSAFNNRSLNQSLDYGITLNI